MTPTPTPTQTDTDIADLETLEDNDCSPEPEPAPAKIEKLKTKTSLVGKRSRRTGKAKFRTPGVFKTKVFKYLEHCKENNEIPFLIGFAVANGCPMTTLDAYKHKPGYEVYYEMIKNASEYTLLTGALTKKISEKMAMFILRANYGYQAENASTPTQASAQTVNFVIAEPPKQLIESTSNPTPFNTNELKEIKG